MIEQGVEKDKKESQNEASFLGYPSLQEMLDHNGFSENPCIIYLGISTSAPDHYWSWTAPQTSIPCTSFMHIEVQGAVSLHLKVVKVFMKLVTIAETGVKGRIGIF